LDKVSYFPYPFLVIPHVRYYFLCSGMTSKSTIRKLPIWVKGATAIIENMRASLELL